MPSTSKLQLAGVCLAVTLLLPAPAQSQAHPAEPLQEAYFAWDEGRYVEAVEGYLEVLTGPEGERYTEEVALLSGELHPVHEVDDDGRTLAISPDGRFIQWSRQVDGEWVTFVEPAPQDGGAGGERHAFPTRTGALSAGGHFAWLDDDVLRIDPLEAGGAQEILLEGLRPVAVAFAPDREELYLTAGQEGEGDRLRIFRLAAPGWVPQLLELGEGHAAEPQPAAGGRYLVFSRVSNSPLSVPEGQEETETPQTGPGILELETGRVLAFSGGSPSVSADGSAVAWLDQSPEGENRVRALRLSDGGLPAGDLRPLTLVETSDRLNNPAVAPDGDRVAYQARPRIRWELFVAHLPAGDEEPQVEQVTREVQHDQFPAWISDTQLLGMKGEFRHRRSYLNDLETGEAYRLFHNNTLRTIAPEYEWVPDPLSRGVFLVAERDGDTIAPERAVFWVDLTRTVSHDALVARLEDALAHERDLLERGREYFAPIADEVRAAADAVSVGRIYHYAEALYSFGPKWAADPGNQLAIEYLAETLASWGYEPELQWFEAGGRAGGVRTANVVATLPGTENPEQIYLISSHFDSVLRSPGADDNSSGTTALLEAARVLADRPQRATIQFVFLTAEEAGLLGAREFVRRAQADGLHIAGVLNNDMIGWTRSHRLDNTIRYSNDGIRDIQHAASNLFSDLITYDARYYRGTDAAVFFDAYGDIVGGIGSYPVLHNPHYHQFSDELWTINQRLVAEVSRTTVATIVSLADGPSRVAGLHRVDEEDAELTFAWDPAPETMVTGYQVRVRTGEGEWVELETVSEPRVQVPAGLDAVEVAVRAVSAEGRTSFDDQRLRREEW